MWTNENWVQYDRSTLRYPSDVTVFARWSTEPCTFWRACVRTSSRRPTSLIQCGG
jgi:hypothetical protein